MYFVTFSLGVLQHDDVVFNPPLPSWKKEAIQSMTMTTYTKIFLQFPSKFWFDNEMGISADRIRGRYPVWQSLDHEKFLPGSGLFFVTVTGDWSVAIESLTDAEVQKDVMPVVHAMFPNVTVPDPIDFYFQRWHSDPLYRGSYSNWPPSFFNKHHENLRATVLERLWFAGEATSKQFFGFLQGAYFEGLLVSKAMISCIKARGDGDVCGLAHVAEVTNTLPYQDLRP